MNQKQEQEWEKEYNLKKAKRKWLLNKKKTEWLEFTQSESTRNKTRLMVKIISGLVLAPLLWLAIFFGIKGYINYSESQKYRAQTPEALIRIEAASQSSIGRLFNVGEISNYNSKKKINFVLSSYTIDGNTLTYRFAPDFRLQDLSATGFSSLDLEILTLNISQLLRDEGSAFNGFICGLSNAEDMKSLAYSNMKIVFLLPDIEKSISRGKFVDQKINLLPVSYLCSLNTKWGFMSSIKND